MVQFPQRNQGFPPSARSSLFIFIYGLDGSCDQRHKLRNVGHQKIPSREGLALVPSVTCSQP